MVISTPFPPEEGIGYYAYNLSKKLIEKGHEVTIFTRGSFRTRYKFYEGINVVEVPFFPLYPFHVNLHGFIFKRLFKSKESDFDLVHIHTPLTPTLNTSLPVVSTIHGSMVENVKAMEAVDFKSIGSKLMLKIITIPLITELISNSKVVTTVSKSVGAELKDNYCLDRLKIIGNGVDVEKFIPSLNQEGYLLYVGRLSYGKGLNDLLESAMQICKQYDLKLFIVGKGELEKSLKNLVKSENLEKYVKFLGRIEQEELVKIYQNASIFVFPSHYEGFPTVVLEAMSSGLPVVASDISAHKDFIEDGVNGFLVKKGSPVEITEKIILLNNNQNLRNQIGANARKTVEEKFTWDIISDRYERIYLNLKG